MRSLRAIREAVATLISVGLIGAAAIAAFVVIGFTVVAVALHVWRSDPPKAAIGGIRCHWNGRYLIARGVVLNFGDHDATFDVQPEIAVAGTGNLGAREDDFVSVKAGRLREWRWTDGHTGVPLGTPVRQCAARVFFPRREAGD